MPTLAELRAKRPANRPSRSFEICLAPHLVAEVQTLVTELESLPFSTADDDADDDGPPAKMGDSTKRTAGERREARAAEIEARLAELNAEMAEHDGVLVVQASKDDGEWLRWLSAHPPRDKDEDPAGYARDFEVTGNPPYRGACCNADDLIDDLGTWAATWDDEPLTDGDWAVLAASMGRADKKQVASGVVQIHENHTDLGKWRAGWSAILRKSPADASPAPSADPQASS